MHEGFTACHDVGNAKAGEAVSLVTGRQGAAILVRVMGIILASTSGGNRADDVGSIKLGTGFALEVV